ncbi:MAG: nitrogen fixation protein NifX [Desulfuromonadia bacterium]
MKIAFTTTDGEMIDLHFGQTSHFQIWEVGADHARYRETVSVPEGDDDEEDRIVRRAEALAGCSIVYTVAIGGPAAAKLVARRIHPMKTGTVVAIADVIEKLQGVLKGTPPPWLRKAMEMT